MPGDVGSCSVKTDGREGTVVSVEGGRATVMLVADGACGKEMSCAHCALFKPEAHSIDVPADGLQPGERVRIRVPAADVYRSILTLLLLPMALTLAGLLIGLSYGGWAAPDGAVAGLVIAYAFAMFVNRRLARRGALRVERLSPRGPA